MTEDSDFRAMLKLAIKTDLLANGFTINSSMLSASVCVSGIVVRDRFEYNRLECGPMETPAHVMYFEVNDLVSIEIFDICGNNMRFLMDPCNPKFDTTTVRSEAISLITTWDKYFEPDWHYPSTLVFKWI